MKASDTVHILVEALLKNEPTVLAKEVATTLLLEQDDPLASLNQLQENLNEFFRVVKEQVNDKEILKSKAAGPTGTPHNQTGATPAHDGNATEPKNIILFDTRTVAPFSTEIIRQVALSGFLNPKDLGRFLLLMSPSIKNELGDDFVWRSLCASKFPTLMTCEELHDFSNEKIFRQFSKLVPTNAATETSSTSTTSTISAWPPISEPKLRAKDLILLVQWYRKKTDPTPLATISVPSEQLEGFLENGRFRIPVTATTDLLFSKDEIHRIYLTIHLARVDKTKCCCLHETGEYSWDPTPQSPVDALQPPNQRPPASATLFLGPRTPVLLASLGKDLETRLARGDRDPGGFELLVLASVTRTPEKHWKVTDLTFQMWANYSDQLYIYDSSVQSTKHGVTLLHILSELQGWED